MFNFSCSSFCSVCCFLIFGDAVFVSAISFSNCCFLCLIPEIFSVNSSKRFSKFSFLTCKPARSAFRSEISLWRASCSFPVDDWIFLLILLIFSCSSSIREFFSLICFFIFSICSFWFETSLSKPVISFSLFLISLSRIVA